MKFNTETEKIICGLDEIQTAVDRLDILIGICKTFFLQLFVDKAFLGL